MLEIGYLLAWLDNRRRPLSKLIQGFDSLRANPAEYLARQEVVIGPTRQIGLLLLMSLVFGTCLGSACLFWPAFLILAAFNQNPEVLLPYFQYLWMLGIIVFFILAWRWTGRRQIRLHPTGVIIRDGRVLVWCPWSLFHTSRQHVYPENERICIAINAKAIPEIVMRDRDRALSQGMEVRTKLFWIGGLDTSPAKNLPRYPQLILADQFQAFPMELGYLLLELGDKLAAQAE